MSLALAFVWHLLLFLLVTLGCFITLGIIALIVYAIAYALREENEEV